MTDTLNQPSGQVCIVCLAERRGLIKPTSGHACGLVMIPDAWELQRYPEEDRKLALSLACYFLKVGEKAIPEFRMHAASKTTIAIANPGELPKGSILGSVGTRRGKSVRPPKK